MNTSYYTDEKIARLQKAFVFVSRRDDWRAPINMRGTRKALETVCRHQGFDFDEILESIRFFTATDPKISVEGVTSDHTPVIVIEADGYRNGPAGDH